jgi:hypothetical protein
MMEIVKRPFSSLDADMVIAKKEMNKKYSWL